jgi:hypothetical protein
MAWIGWHAVSPASADVSAMFLSLFMAVMAPFAECLPVGLIPEQFPVASMRLDMVYNGVGSTQRFSTDGAKWMLHQKTRPNCTPLWPVHAVILTHFILLIEKIDDSSWL